MRLMSRMFVLMASLLTTPIPVRAEDPPPLPQPVIYCANPLFDFGKVLQGKTVTHDFILENHGQAALNVLSVDASCNCTTVSITRQIIEPGTSAKVKAVFDSKTFDGPVVKEIAVSCSDPANRLFKLEFKANVIRPFETAPPAVDFQRVSRNYPAEKSLTLRGNEGKTPRVLAIEVEGETAVEARYEKPEGAPTTTLVFRLKPGAPVRLLGGTVKVTLDDPDCPLLRIPIHGRLLDDVTVYPTALDFGTLAPGQALQRPVLVLVAHPEARIQAVTAEPDLIETTLAERAEGFATPPAAASPGATPSHSLTRSFEIRLKARPDAPAGSVKGTLTIRTTSRDQAEITVPLNGVISGGEAPK